MVFLVKDGENPKIYAYRLCATRFRLGSLDETLEKRRIGRIGG